MHNTNRYKIVIYYMSVYFCHRKPRNPPVSSLIFQQTVSNQA